MSGTWLTADRSRNFCMRIRVARSHREIDPFSVSDTPGPARELLSTRTRLSC